jgi:hypothetical protein
MLPVGELVAVCSVPILGLITIGVRTRARRAQRSRMNPVQLNPSSHNKQARTLDDDPNKWAVQSFIKALTEVAPAAGGGHYAFRDVAGDTIGFVQIIPQSEHQITIHRLWTLAQGIGSGSAMLDAMCKLADRYRVLLKLRPLPFGRKPYPMEREKLLAWYARHGFVGNRRGMIREPREAIVSPDYS